MTTPAVTQVLLEAAFRALLIALVLWLGMRLIRMRNALVQKATWTMVLAAAVAMPFVVRWQLRPTWAAVSLPKTNWLMRLSRQSHRRAPAIAAPVSRVKELDTAAFDLPQSKEAAVAADSYTEFDDQVSPTGSSSSLMSPVAAPIPAQTAPEPLHWLSQALGWAWLLYLAVGASLLLRLAYGLGSSVRLWVQARRIEPTKNLCVPDRVEVRWSGRVTSPVNIGSGILLPGDYAEWDDEKLRVVLAHEYAHIQQRDFYLQMIAGLYAAVVWFSPLGWWLKRKLSELGEAISDKAGLDAAGSPVAYAELLLEFAARPRPTFAGVAMAHSTNLHQRIERLLNETNFSRVFAGRRYMFVALVLPAVLIAASALVHVQAAVIPSQSNMAQSLTSQTVPEQPELARTVQSRPDQGTGVESASAGQVKAQESTTTPDAAPAPSPATEATPAPAPSPAPVPHVHVQVTVGPIAPVVVPKLAITIPMFTRPLVLNLDGMPKIAALDPFQIVVPQPGDAARDGYRDTYRVFGDEEHHRFFDGNLSADCEAGARKTRDGLQGQVLFVCHDGKPYVINDPDVLAQITGIDKEMNDKSEQMKALSKQLRDQSQGMREEARKERETAEKFPKPDISKEIAELDAAAAALKADQDGNISREQLQELQRKLSEVQRRLISTEVKVDVNMSVAMSKLSADQGKFGEQMGKLGSEMGQLAHERDQKIRSLIDESLKNGKAKPVN